MDLRDVYEPTLSLLWAWAQQIQRMPLNEMIHAANRADSLGAVLDPTLYRDKHKAMSQDMELLNAFASVKRVLDNMRKEGE